MTRGQTVSRAAVLALLALIAVLTAYRAWLVSHSGITLFLDEAQYWDWARELAWGYYSKPPVIAWLIWLSTTLFGDGLLGVKAAGMLLYPVIALALWGCGRAMFGPRAGAVTALAFITAPLAALLGLFVSTDAPLLLCWTLAVWSGWRVLGPDSTAMNRPDWSGWLVLGLSLGLGVLSKYTMVAIVPGLLWALWRWRPAGGMGSPAARARWIGASVASLLAIALVLPHLVWNLRNGAPTLRHTVEITATAHRAGGLPALGEFIVSQTLLLGPIATLVLLMAAWRYCRRVRRPGPAETTSATQATQAPQAPTVRADIARNAAVDRATLHYLLALALPLLGLALLQSVNAHAHMNWAAPAYISGVLLLGRVLATRPRWLLASVLFNLLVVGLVTHAADLAKLTGKRLPPGTDAFVRMRGYDRAYAELRPSVAARPGWLVVSSDRSLLAQAAYQWRDLGVRPQSWNPQHTADNHYELSTSFGSQRGRDALFLSVDPLPPEVLAYFSALDEQRETRVEVAPRRFVTVRLYALRGFKGYD